jgi:hypothetical protein
VSAAIAAVLAPIPQDPAYHRMADSRGFLGIPNALNVLSNLPFVLAGVAGLGALGSGGIAFLDPRERWPYAVFFGGLTLTGLGSAYYHLAPGDARLMWDRLPLAITIMALFAATIAERIAVGAGLALLGPLVALGVGSVLYWHAGETRGHGDLRLYGFVQFYPMLAIPLMIALFPARYTGTGDLGVTVAFYAVAKVFELADRAILSLGHLVSGHTIKHLMAALAGYWILRMLRSRIPLHREVSA